MLNSRGYLNVDIHSVCNDSRKVAPGALFVAVKGFASDGHDYIKNVIEKGAVAIIYEDESKVCDLPEGITLVQVKSSRYALAIAAANFYDNPSRKLTLVGITGTNGKTTTVTLLHRMFTALGYSCGLLSTIANYVGSRGSRSEEHTSELQSL